MLILFGAKTIDLPDPLFRELKAIAAQRGTSLKNVIRIALEQEIRQNEGMSRRRVKFPLLSSQEPGSLDLSNAEIDDLSA
jgi:hypothetical protein